MRQFRHPIIAASARVAAAGLATGTGHGKVIAATMAINGAGLLHGHISDIRRIKQKLDFQNKYGNDTGTG